MSAISGENEPTLLSALLIHCGPQKTVDLSYVTFIIEKHTGKVRSWYPAGTVQGRLCNPHLLLPIPGGMGLCVSAVSSSGGHHPLWAALDLRAVPVSAFGCGFGGVTTEWCLQKP